MVKTARTANPGLKILISFGYCNDVAKAATSPEAFAQGLADIVQRYELDGFDIDWEQSGKLDLGDFTSAKFATFMDHINNALGKVVAQPILTVCPAFLSQNDDPLRNKAVLDKFTYVMPQTYGHGGNETRADDYALVLGSYDKIVYGINGEGYVDPPSWGLLDVPDDPGVSWEKMKQNNAAGVFLWRIDTDSMPEATPHECTPQRCDAGQCDLEGDLQLPTCAVAQGIWQLKLGHY